MVAYPDQIYSPTPAILQDNVDVVVASHVNELRAEVKAIESSVGVDPAFSPVTNTLWPSMSDRVTQIENTAFQDLSGTYTKRTGGSIIRNVASNCGGLAIDPGAQGTFAALEVMSSDRSWEAGDSTRSTIKLWGDGRIEASGTLLGDGETILALDPTADMVIESTGGFSVSQTGTVTAASGAAILDGDVDAVARAALDIKTAGVVGLQVKAGSLTDSAALQVLNDGDQTFAVSKSGVLTVGSTVGGQFVVIDGSARTLTLGPVSLSSSGVVINTDTYLSTSEMSVAGAVVTGGGLTVSGGLRELSFAAHRESGHDVSRLRVGEDEHLFLGVEGTSEAPSGASLSEHFSQFVSVTPSGVTLTGEVSLPHNPTTVWPDPNVWDVPNTLWLDTQPKTTGPSDRKPNYWDEFYNVPGGLQSETGFEFTAPATGRTKITVSATLYGAITRTAVSFQVVDVETDLVSWDYSHGRAIAINAPIPATATDPFYSDCTQIVVGDFTPGRVYKLVLRGQRGIPGSDASGPFFPGHGNFLPSSVYPWGRWFPVEYLRVMVEPVF